MKAVPAYGKILALGSAMTENALVGHVTVQEKIDGSQFGFGLNDEGQLVMRSKGMALTEDNHADMFAEGVKYILSLYSKMRYHVPVDTYFYCEYLQKPKHNTLKYNQAPTNHLVLFDAMSQGRFLSRDELKKFSHLFEIDLIPELYSGLMNADKVKEFLQTEAYLGGEILEGIVIKNYEQTILLGGQVFPLFTKYVREGFKERHVVEWKIKQPKDSLADYVNGFRSEARWQKAIIHAREKQLLTQSPRDIGMLLKMVQQDILEEETENIKQYLFKCFKDDILRKSVQRFPEWYKEQLLANLNSEGQDS